MQRRMMPTLTSTDQRRRNGLPALAAGVFLLPGSIIALRAQDSALTPSGDVVFPPRAMKDWAAIEPAVEAGLRFLRESQAASGAVGSRCPVAVTSLAGLAVLGAGHQPQEGPHGEMLDKCLGYLKGAARPLPRANDGRQYFTDEGETRSRMHGHCYAVLFLCELYGSLPRREAEIADLIRRAIPVIEGAQSKEGGWYYEPDDILLDESSVTVCALQALRAARNVGFSVEVKRIDRAISYVKRCQDTKDFSFKYSLSPGVDGHDRTSYALTTAALSTLNSAGVYRSPELQKGLDYVRRMIGSAKSPWHAAEEEHDYYANLYAAQTLYQDGGDLWTAWYPKVREHLLRKQRSDGRWENGPWGDEYATAMALLILEVPLGYLPIFQR